MARLHASTPAGNMRHLLLLVAPSPACASSQLVQTPANPRAQRAASHGAPPHHSSQRGAARSQSRRRRAAALHCKRRETRFNDRVRPVRAEARSSQRYCGVTCYVLSRDTAQRYCGVTPSATNSRHHPVCMTTPALQQATMAIMGHPGVEHATPSQAKAC